ncbi:MarR family winged helix-turn-helix transcriptional regulator [Nocardia fluminea]|uniref:DNA-binding MarR family transcriptional regulator n=1 Tax=Nocardia fluminea TaxID=134984 RepID=A0A2N3VJX3_9NOCA|nr:MarR family transcriptional regulator [Nocardia fluminea]PKV81914.1 DNA-binding MarR family transcriptional regulator [Nocardia fluminea]
MSKDSEMIGEIGQQLRLLQRSFDTFDEAVAARLRLNRTDMRCLDVVLARGLLSAGELSSALRLSPAATTTVIDRLERAGYVSRAQDPGNRRRVLIEPTTDARRVAEVIFEPVGRAGAAALGRYDSDQLGLILDFLGTALRVHREQADLVAERTRNEGSASGW